MRLLVGVAAAVGWLPPWALAVWFLEASIAVPALLAAVLITGVMWATVVLMVRPRRRPLAVVAVALAATAVGLAWVGLGYIVEDSSSSTDVFDGLGQALGQVFLVAAAGVGLVGAGAWWVRARLTVPTGRAT